MNVDELREKISEKDQMIISDFQKSVQRLKSKMQSDRRKAISRFIESNRKGLSIVDLTGNKDSKKIYFVRSNINKEEHNRVSMINRIKKWWNERVENANRIAFDITSSNQEAMEKVLNIGKKKK